MSFKPYSFGQINNIILLILCFAKLNVHGYCILIITMKFILDKQVVIYLLNAKQ